jgi:hypothetical protein
VQRLIRESENREGVEQALRDLHAHTRDVLRANLSGTLFQRRGLAAALRVLDDPEVSAADVGEVLAAVWLCREREGAKRFPSEASFRWALIGNYRKLSRLAYGSYWCNRSNRTQPVYRELGPQIVNTLAEVLVTAYSRFAAHILTRAQGKTASEIRAKIDAAFATPEGSRACS